jgi:hypothetical protein
MMGPSESVMFCIQNGGNYNDSNNHKANDKAQKILCLLLRQRAFVLNTYEIPQQQKISL